jgi:hypothetical protein
MPGRFIALFLVRDEADVLPETLTHTLTWADEVHVLDTGSTDGSWEIVHDFARRDSRVRPFASAPLSAHLGLRGVMFEAIRHTFRPGDWIGRCDADEIYHVLPPRFIEEHVRPWEGRVFASFYNFALLRDQLDQPDTPAHARVIDALRHFTIDTSMWAESRWYRYRPGMRWRFLDPNPVFPGLAAERRIPIRHYRNRSLPQIAHRLALRNAMKRLDGHGEHWAIADPTSVLLDRADPNVHFWPPGSSLPANLPGLQDRRHWRSLWRHLAQAGLYLSGWPRVADARVREGDCSGSMEAAIQRHSLGRESPLHPSHSPYERPLPPDPIRTG